MQTNFSTESESHEITISKTTRSYAAATKELRRQQEEAHRRMQDALRRSDETRRQRLENERQTGNFQERLPGKSPEKSTPS